MFASSGSVLRECVDMKFRMIQRCRDAFPIRLMCRCLRVSASGYYGWATRAPSARTKENARLLARIRHLHTEHDGVMGGVPTIHGGAPHHVSHERGGQLCRQRRRGKFLWRAQTGAGQSAVVPDPSGGESGYLCLHRTLAQSPATATTRVPATGKETLNSRVRGNGVEPVAHHDIIVALSYLSGHVIR